MKLVALYKQPPDPAAFDDVYYKTHLPLIAQVPGLRQTKITVSHCWAKPFPDGRMFF
jgi:uncharacterized protein (TIGR02118 family)